MIWSNIFFLNLKSKVAPLLIATGISLALIIVATPVLAQTAQDQQEDLLFNKLASATSETEARMVEFQIWEHWTAEAPSDEIRDKLTRGMEKRREFDLAWAEDLFDEVVREAPEYAEGWNQRGFARFLRGNLEGSLSDLESAIELEPRHFGALSGMYHVLRLLNRQDAALRSLHKAVTIHPWLKERNDLPEKLRPKMVPVQEL